MLHSSVVSSTSVRVSPLSTLQTNKTETSVPRTSCKVHVTSDRLKHKSRSVHTHTHTHNFDKKITNTKFNENLSGENRPVPCGRTLQVYRSLFATVSECAYKMLTTEA
jgi:hypothetical protein